ARTLGLLGDAPAVADSEARRILALETALARASLTRVARRDPNANYHKLTLPAADSLTPHFAWASFPHETGAPATASTHVGPLAMVDNLIAALDDRLHTLEWMSDTTRLRALAKLRAFGKKIGYPDKWRDYGKLSIDRGDLVGNVVRAQTFNTARTLSRIGLPLDRAEWRMTPPTVNATYSPSFNDITFPAGILQAPFFDPAADD